MIPCDRGLKVDVVLIFPPSTMDELKGKYDKNFEANPPLGLAYIAAVLEKNDISVAVIDACAEQLNLEQIMYRITVLNPTIVGFSSVTSTMPVCINIAKAIKQDFPEMVIVMGGIHPTLMPEKTLEQECVDIVIKGEGEFAFLDIARAIKAKKSIKEIRGIFHKVRGRIIASEEREFIKNLDEIPFPAWYLFPLQRYKPLPHWALTSPDDIMFPVITSKGCCYRCTFCSLQTSGKIVRRRSIKNVVDEIEWLVKEFGAKQIVFWDATFPLDRNRGLEFCKEMINRKLNEKVTWMTETRVNVVDRTLLWQMKKAGCKRIAYGVESGSQKLLDNVCKGFLIGQVKEAVKLTHELGIETLGFFMIGLPGETEETARQTIEFAKELDMNYAKFNVVVPYPGTELWEQGVKEGIFKTEDWERFASFGSLNDFNPVYVPQGMSQEQLIKLTKRAFKEYYFRPRMIIKHLKKIKSLGDIIKYIKTAKILLAI